MTPTLRSLGLTAAISLPWPALLFFLGRVVDNPLNESEFVRALAESLQFTAVCLLLLEFLRQLCRSDGLADAHFGWPQSCLLQVRRKIRWLSLFGLPLVLCLVGLETQRVAPLWSSSLGRVCFIGFIILLALTIYQLLLANGSPFRQLVHHRRGTWMFSIDRFWRPLVVFLPGALAFLAVIGYYYTAQHAAVRMLETTALVLALLVVGELTRRWLLVSRRRLAREQARQRRAQLAAAAEKEGTELLAETADESVDLAALSEQTQQLVRTLLFVVAAVGIFFIWREVLPALAWVGDSPILQLDDVANPLTWGQILLFVVILGLTYLGVRDLPALLELIVLQKLPLDSGSRYALSTISRYLLAALGLSAAYYSLGFTGENVQWLIAAMGVGLGFGLQEIFANFVSGVILLFERPIRVGDIVT
ncbi:MAG: mechanosensitive ion channel domain-containing protein, partial [Planctomycetota bacterium]